MRNWMHTTAAVLILSECILAVCLTTSGASQEPTPQPKQTESGKSKQTGRKPKEEEEDTTKPARKVPLRVGDEDQETNPPASGKPGTVPATDLEREAKQAKHPAVQQLFSTLAKPHDVITMVKSLHVWHVEPIAEYLNPKAGSEQKLTLHPFDPSGNARQSFSVSSKEIFSFEPYEQLALKKVDEFLKSGLQQDATSKRYLSRLEMFQEAEKALGAVLLFHDSAVERGLRKGSAWNESRQQLVAKLQEVQLNQLETLIDLKNWEGALDLGIRLAEAYPAQKNFQDRIIRLLARSAREPLKNKQYPLTRKWLLVLEAQFPGSAELKPIRTKLQEEAQNYLNQAKALDSKKQTQAALEKLNLAKDIDPELPGLRDFELRLTQANPVLSVAVHDLPEYLSPATAYFDSEKQAVELLFESLLTPMYSSRLGQCYRPSLAADLPRMVSLGRQFTLARGACWSNGLPVTATDVRSTVGLLCDSKARGYIPEWAEFLKGGAQIGADSFHISLTLHQGYLDPLSLMDFKVLPDRISRIDDPDFAKNPIGSGPYKFEKRESGRVLFVANPFYERRPGKAGLPRIREIHFFRSENPINDFHEGHLQLLLDLPTSRLKDLENSAGLQDVTFKTLPNRRIYFLAVNHRRPPLDNEPLRRAIAHAINRETILNECFRAGRTPPPHQPLNGPYPCQSWAYNRELARDPYSLDLAKAQAKKAKEGLPVLRKLSLKYPKGDPDVERACQMIRSEVQQLGEGIDLDLVALEPRALQRDVEEMNEYDLAYYSWEYPDETYWLWPLFDPQATNRGGRNFLGYQNDDRLQRLFREAMSHRDPAEVKRLTHKIHATFADKMPFIPLWQLDTHLAIHNSLSMVDGQRQSVDPDPLRIFTNVETWVLGKH